LIALGSSTKVFFGDCCTFSVLEAIDFKNKFVVDLFWFKLKERADRNEKHKNCFNRITLIEEKIIAVRDFITLQTKITKPPVILISIKCAFYNAIKCFCLQKETFENKVLFCIIFHQ